MYKLKEDIDINFILKKLGYEELTHNRIISNISSYNNAIGGSLSFCTSRSDIPFKGSLCLSSIKFSDKSYYYTENPRDIFCQILDFLVKNNSFLESSEHYISKSANISPLASIEHGVYIEDNVVIHDFANIKKGVHIGKNTVINSFASIGSDGFGFGKSKEGNNLRFPHLGGVHIGENCEIGVLNSINRGTLSDTIIGDYVKTDAQVHIAHNCIIGANSILTAGVTLSGGVELKNNVWLGPNSAVIQKVVLGGESFVGIGAVVTKSVAQESVVAGNPARILKNR
ncbi:LbetaH domain-containing protein [Photobacterium leiognathi]|uniref:hypothetical protein n=1 Tax=Photobacterium leiognathi TaxID=553611 RepID=UPI002980F156|nr:hypothetical protein [Photobacterium leiognathi]